MATNFDKDWTPFAMDAEAGAFGTARICKTHNQLRKRTEELEKLLQQQEDYTEMLMRYMARHEQSAIYAGKPVSWWDIFSCEYQSTAAELGKWLESRHASPPQDR